MIAAIYLYHELGEGRRNYLLSESFFLHYSNPLYTPVLGSVLVTNYLTLPTTLTSRVGVIHCLLCFARCFPFFFPGHIHTPHGSLGRSPHDLQLARPACRGRSLVSTSFTFVHIALPPLPRDWREEERQREGGREGRREKERERAREREKRKGNGADMCNGIAQLMETIKHYSNFPATGVSLRQMVQFGSNPSIGMYMYADLTGRTTSAGHVGGGTRPTSSMSSPC